MKGGSVVNFYSSSRNIAFHEKCDGASTSKRVVSQFFYTPGQLRDRVIGMFHD